jgi:formylglycine-generating enzyme required for sulfatase activity
VAYVSWYDAMAYCGWLAKVTGQSYNLPSEAEWEKAASWDAALGRKWIWPWGDEWDETRCNSEERGISDTTPVDAYPRGASRYGVLDMAGNVYEWTRSLHKGYLYDPTDGREDLSAQGRRVFRGGSFVYGPDHARCACRGRDIPDLRDWDIGFRLVAPIS